MMNFADKSGRGAENPPARSEKRRKRICAEGNLIVSAISTKYRPRPLTRPKVSAGPSAL